MSLTPEYVGPPGFPTDDAGGPGEPRRTLTLELPRLPAAATAIGVALVLASVVVAATYARKHGDLDGSVFTLGALASLGLLAVAIVGELTVPGLERRTAMVSWAGAAGIAGAGLMTAVLIADDSAFYLVPLLVLLLSAGGFLVRRTAPFVLTGLAALAVGYGWLVATIFDDAEDDFVWVWAFALVGFVIVVTSLAWLLLPAMRALVGLTLGAAALFANGSSLFFPFLLLVGGTGFLEDEAGNPLRDDAYALLCSTALLMVFWAACAIGSGHVGFRVLIVAAALGVTPSALSMLAPRHPSWWQLGFGAIGGLALVVAALQARKGSDGPGGSA